MSCSHVTTWEGKRTKTIALLRQLADGLDEMENDVNISKVTGTSAAIAGGLGTLGCIIAAPFTGGLSTLGIAGFATLGAAGGAVNIGALIGKHFHESGLIKDVQKALDEDRKESENLNMAAFTIGETGKKDVDIGRNIVEAAAKAVSAVAFLPVDINDLVETSIKVNNGSINKSAKKVRRIANELEAEMKKTGGSTCAACAMKK
ncbi:uncharacterized protein LOC110450288 [Mizuhopecten yessoensis]|uniref:Apolipoprotein L3 n=1 Tax=Mizuhopecten yessoensis TaxID=6573 RepID=A0A210QPB7_MIZYE|nr:uncharacterized protein LOC110450288 [Mizuhopecten yessoensis]OWF50582.1 Apolipoprotein L3 [Mizuhopecten yessoensis]